MSGGEATVFEEVRLTDQGMVCLVLLQLSTVYFFFFLLYGYLVSIIFRTCEYDYMKFMM